MPWHVDWTEQYKIGVYRIDLEHEELFRLANLVLDLRGADRDTLETIFLGLSKYCRYHFAGEEKLMADIGYPGLAEQRILHKTIIKQMDEVLGGARDMADLQGRLQQFMRGWIVKHVLEVDLRLAEFVKTKGITLPG